jgi:hypothetical protein
MRDLPAEEGRRLAADAFLRAVAERDDGKAVVLIEQAGDAFVDCVRAEWGERLRAARALLEEAEAALDRAEAASDPTERRRQLALFELCLSVARIEGSR